MIFLTGGTGLVGAHILLKLTESGQKVKALKRKRTLWDPSARMKTISKRMRVHQINININPKVAAELALFKSSLLLFIVKSTLLLDDFSIINWSLYKIGIFSLFPFL